MNIYQRFFSNGPNMRESIRPTLRNFHRTGGMSVSAEMNLLEEAN